MQYRTLGRTGVQVSIASFGTLTFGKSNWNVGSSNAESERIFHAAYDAGVNLFDTANVYGKGNSELFLGNLLTSEIRNNILIATKCHGKMDDNNPNSWGNTRRNIIKSCEDSLKRLNTDWIDLFQLHRPHPNVPIDEAIRALDDLIRSGKVRYIGTSTFAAWQACEAHYVAKSLGANAFVTEQPPYNLLDRRVERELIPFCRTYDIAVLPWSPLAGGQLSGKYLDEMPDTGRYVKSDPHKRFIGIGCNYVKSLKAIADKYEMSLAALSLSWLAHQKGVTSVIIGATSVDQLEENLLACQIELSEEILEEIDAVVPPGSYVIDYYSAQFGPNKVPLL